LKSKQSLSIHFGVFQLTFEAIDEPEYDLGIALKENAIDDSAFWTLEPGEARALTPASDVDIAQNNI
jgi:hypothetical protein